MQIIHQEKKSEHVKLRPKKDCLQIMVLFQILGVTPAKSQVDSFKGISRACARLFHCQRKVHSYLFQFDSVHSTIQPDCMFYLFERYFYSSCDCSSLLSFLILVFLFFSFPPSILSFLPLFSPSSSSLPFLKIIFAHFLVHAFSPS